MATCGQCEQTIPDTAIRCGACGAILVDGTWRPVSEDSGALSDTVEPPPIPPSPAGTPPPSPGGTPHGQGAAWSAPSDPAASQWSGGRPPGTPAYPQQPAGQYPPAAAPTTNGLAVASLVLGIVWCYWVGSILAVVFGHLALGQIKKDPGRQAGKGLAIAGVVLGWLGVATLAVVALLWVVGLAAAPRW